MTVIKFRLRSLIVFVALSSAAIGWFALKAKQARDRTMIYQRFGAYADFDGGRVSLDVRVPRNLDRLHELGDVRSIDFSHLTRLDRVAIGSLRSLRSLESLRFDGQRLTPVDFENLGRLDTLKSLILTRVNVSEDDLSEVARLQNLRVLGLGRTSVTDKGLECLSNLDRLEALYLWNASSVTDTAICHLRNLRKLRWLDARGTQISAHGVRELQKALPNCRVFTSEQQNAEGNSRKKKP